MGAARLGRAVVSSRVVWEGPTEKRPEEEVSLLTHVPCLLLCVGHSARHWGGSPGNISILSLAFFYKETRHSYLGLHVTDI